MWIFWSIADVPQCTWKHARQMASGKGDSLVWIHKRMEPTLILRARHAGRKAPGAMHVIMAAEDQIALRHTSHPGCLFVFLSKWKLLPESWKLVLLPPRRSHSVFSGQFPDKTNTTEEKLRFHNHPPPSAAVVPYRRWINDVMTNYKPLIALKVQFVGVIKCLTETDQRVKSPHADFTNGASS